MTTHDKVKRLYRINSGMSLTKQIVAALYTTTKEPLLGMQDWFNIQKITYVIYRSSRIKGKIHIIISTDSEKSHLVKFSIFS